MKEFLIKIRNKDNLLDITDLDAVAKAITKKTEISFIVKSLATRY